MSDVPRLVSVLEAAITAADARAQADAAIIANLQRQLEQANNRAYQAEHDRHQAEAHADRAEQRAEGADLAWEAENKRADQAEQARDLLQAAFSRCPTLFISSPPASVGALNGASACAADATTAARARTPVGKS